MSHTLPPVKGIPLNLGGVDYILPPANLATLEAMADRLDKVNAVFAAGGSLSIKDMLFVTDFATQCLQRNYPTLDRAVVAQHVGLDNVMDVMQMCLDTSGLLRKQHEGAAATPSTATGGGTLGESSGTASSPTS